MANFFTKHWRLIGVILGIILFLWLLYWLRTFVLPFATGLVLAYLLMPVVLWIEPRLPPRKKWPGFRRIISVLITLLLLVCVIGAFAYFVVSAVVDASMNLLDSAPYFIEQSLQEIQEWLDDVLTALPEDIREEVNEGISEGGVALGNAIRTAVIGWVQSIPSTFGLVMGFAVLPFFLFYLLKDSEKLKTGLIASFSEKNALHVRRVSTIVEQVLGRYIRAQLLLGFIVALLSFIGLHILGVPYTLSLAMIAGVGELVPIVGPWISGGIAVLVTLAVMPEKAIWVAVVFVAVQLLENNLFVPKIQSAYLRIHPAIMIVLLVFGTYIAGFWGLLIIGPLTATLVEIFRYIRGLYRTPEVPATVEGDG